MQHPYMLTDDDIETGHRLSTGRYEKTLAFLGEKLEGKALDIGSPTPITDMIRQKYSLDIDNTEGDLDEVELTGTYDIVFSFEVLEHLFNPLFHLRQVHKVLKPDGRFFLSTPRHKPYFLWFKYHFHEMHIKQLTDLVNYAGFEIVRREAARVHPWSFYLSGVRPLLRLIFERTWLMELKKKGEGTKQT